MLYSQIITKQRILKLLNNCFANKDSYFRVILFLFASIMLKFILCLTIENHRQFESLYVALSLLIIELKILLAELHLEFSKLGAIVIHVRALLIHLFLNHGASLSWLAKEGVLQTKIWINHFQESS